MLVPGLKTTLIASAPLPVDCDTTYSMLSTPLISCSIGVATVWAITSADAPAKLAFTTTVGGAISGYSVIGRARSEMYPISVMIIEMTLAKIGRSTKKWENRM